MTRGTRRIDARCSYLGCASLQISKIGFFKSERILKQILCIFSKQINPRSLRLRCIKGTEDSTFRVDSLVPLLHHDRRDLGLICLVKKHKTHFRILSDLSKQ